MNGQLAKRKKKKKQMPWRSGMGLARKMTERQTQASFKGSLEKVMTLISINTENRNSISISHILCISYSKIKTVTKKMVTNIYVEFTHSFF